MPSARTLYVDREFIQNPFPALRAGKHGKPVTTTDAGALDINCSVNAIAMVSGTNKVQTLEDGDEGQEVTVYLVSKGGAGNAVLTPAHLTGGTTITFSTAGQFAKLAFLKGSWQIIASTGTLA